MASAQATLLIAAGGADVSVSSLLGSFSSVGSFDNITGPGSKSGSASASCSSGDGGDGSSSAGGSAAAQGSSQALPSYTLLLCTSDPLVPFENQQQVGPTRRVSRQQVRHGQAVGQAQGAAAATPSVGVTAPFKRGSSRLVCCLPTHAPGSVVPHLPRAVRQLVRAQSARRALAAWQTEQQQGRPEVAVAWQGLEQHSRLVDACLLNLLSLSMLCACFGPEPGPALLSTVPQTLVPRAPVRCAQGAPGMQLTAEGPAGRHHPGPGQHTRSLCRCASQPMAGFLSHWGWHRCRGSRNSGYCSVGGQCCGGRGPVGWGWQGVGLCPGGSTVLAGVEGPQVDGRGLG